jgi:hypothetical protein
MAAADARPRGRRGAETQTRQSETTRSEERGKGCDVRRTEEKKVREEERGAAWCGDGGEVVVERWWSSANVVRSHRALAPVTATPHAKV